MGVVGLNSIDPKVVKAIRASWILNMTMVDTSDGLILSVVISPLTIQSYFNFTEAFEHGYTE